MAGIYKWGVDPSPHVLGSHPSSKSEVTNFAKWLPEVGTLIEMLTLRSFRASALPRSYFFSKFRSGEKHGPKVGIPGFQL